VAGIYLHIPFCKRKCHYCNFFSLASVKHLDHFPVILIREAELQRDYLQGAEVNTIYFGGGTPSMLPAGAVVQILEALRRTFTISPGAEITLEANPDDLDAPKLHALRQAGINRLSIGIQSFREADLQYLNRTHTPEHSMNVVRLAQDAGFANLSIDLIFGIPTLTAEGWDANLKQAFRLGVPHISAYALTVEPRTALEVMIRQGKTIEPTDETSAHQFGMLMQRMEANGYLQYEISNFCLPGFESRHNSSYWSGEPYLGLGPSAHSYNGTERRWNVNNLSEWITKTRAGVPCFESETLTPAQRHNEYVMTSLRTLKGCDLRLLSQVAGEEAAAEFTKRVLRYHDSGDLVCENGIYRLSSQGKLFADGISADLFIDPADD
jgi:putative oxygen-independent coproporphyrinogen III oxidase